MSEIEFGELPSHGNASTPGKYEKIIAAIKERPGDWARVDTADTPGKAGQRANRLKTRGAEATTRKNGEGTDVWARWPVQNGDHP